MNRPLPAGLHPTRWRCAPPRRSQYGENSEALYLTSGFVQPDAETSAHRFANPEEGYTYGRTGNPTVTSFEQRLAALEGTEAAIATATGMAAILLMCIGLLKAGDHVVCSQSMFGSTMKLLGKEFAKLRRGDHLRVADRRGRSGAPPCAPTRACCLPKRRPTR
jgi:O-succinylhomoserine sulfhydrylase